MVLSECGYILTDIGLIGGRWSGVRMFNAIGGGVIYAFGFVDLGVRIREERERGGLLAGWRYRTGLGKFAMASNYLSMTLGFAGYVLSLAVPPKLRNMRLLRLLLRCLGSLGSAWSLLIGLFLPESRGLRRGELLCQSEGGSCLSVHVICRRDLQYPEQFGFSVYCYSYSC
jgi:hypothetical protein